MQLRQLGNSGPSTSAIGLGCMGMSGMYGPADRQESLATIQAALDSGVSLIDTGDFYGMGHNEMLIGEALKGGRRDQAIISVKFGALRDPAGGWSGNDARPAAVKNFLAYSLQRLGVDHIDIYRPARLDPRVPIEETVGAIGDMGGPGTCAISAYPRSARRRSDARQRRIRSATCRSSTRFCRAGSRRPSCRPAGNWGSGSRPMASFRAG
jgi:aryl-alcohol dehydrogenase-like predicted oxidoreductase